MSGMNVFSRYARWMVIVVSPLLLAVSIAAADSDQDAARGLREAGEIMSLETILEKARVARPGRVLEVELEAEHGRRIYKIEILDQQGTVWEMKLDAATGELLETEKEH